jgi:hypothetical protein
MGNGAGERPRASAGAAARRCAGAAARCLTRCRAGAAARRRGRRFDTGGRRTGNGGCGRCRTVSGPPPAGEDLALDWRAPVDQSLVEQPSIFLTGLAPAGTSLRAGDGAPIAVSGPFRIPVRLSLGRNSLVLFGERGEQKAELRRAVYYVDVAQLGAMRRRFEELKLQLHSIQVLREDLRGTILTLRARQAKHTAGSEAAADLENVEKAQLMLQDDLTATLAELDGLLRRAAAPQGR